MNLSSFTRRLDGLAKRIDSETSCFVRWFPIHRILKSTTDPIHLHVGCGTVRLKGWLNTDFYKSEAADFAWDAGYPYPLPAESCQFIYNEHFLEHLPLPVAKRFLAECHRLLPLGGVLRIAMPSLEAVAGKYNSPDWQEQEWLKLPENSHIQTPCEMLNTAFRGWGHQWLYDREELQRYLREAKFRQVRFVEPGRSVVPELCNLETRPDSLLVCEAVK